MQTKAHTPPGLLIAAPRSGSGKTTVTLGLLRAFARAGTAVQPFKCGPDYIDTAFHSAAAGRTSYNLDSWSMSEATLASIASAADGAELSIAEGLMGLFDGVATPGRSGDGSSAGLAAIFGWPVVLVLDVSGQSQSAAATALGFARMREDISIAGVILNRIGSPRHERLIRGAMDAVGINVLGALPRRGDLILPERHLGLVQAEETADLDARIEALADFVEAHVNMDALRALAGGRSILTPVDSGTDVFAGIRHIALARDAAFTFVYPHLLKRWQDAGVAVSTFSPLADEPPPPADLCWLPGGYPELHAAKFAAASRFKQGLRDFARHAPVHGECGGYMVLGTTLTSADGVDHAMTGLLGLETSFAKRSMHLGYRHATLRTPTAFARAGSRFFGHEFHYASVTTHGDDEPLYDAVDANGEPVRETGTRRGDVTGSFFHMIDT